MLILPLLVAFPVKDLLAQPNYYVYKGHRVTLEAEKNSLALRYRSEKTNAQNVSHAQSMGVHATTSRSMGYGHWNMLSVEGSMDDVDSQIKTLAVSPEVEFVSPVFHGEKNTPVILTQDVLVKFKAEYVSRVATVLNTVAPELTIINDHFGAMWGAYQLRSTSKNGLEVLATANRLVEEGYAEWSEPDMIFQGEQDLIPNDPGFGNQWGIRNTGQYGGTSGMDMKGDLAWNITTGDTSVKVLVIDCGVQQDHPDIHQLPGVDFTGQGGGGGPVSSIDDHGTAVAGCITGIINNGIGIAGIAPNCYIVSARSVIKNSLADESITTQSSWTVNALAYAATHGIRITNNSNSYFGVPTSAIDAEYQMTHDSLGMIHFASAGNSGNTGIHYPASLGVVNAVGALTMTGTRASFSNYGPGIDFAAPGDSIYTTDRTGAAGYNNTDNVMYRGTSFASPYAAGVAALILSRFPAFTAQQVEAKMQNTCTDIGTAGKDTVYGWGFVNAYNAVRSSCILISPSDIIVPHDSAQSGAVVNFSGPAITGDCSPVTCTPPSGSFFPIGTTLVTCSDTTGNQCTFTVTVTSTVNTITVRKLYDEDANINTSSDRMFTRWNLTLYKDSVDTVNVIGTVTSSESLTVADLVSGTYIAVEADSAGWTNIGKIHDGTLQQGVFMTDTIVISSGRHVSVDFVNTKPFVYGKSWNMISIPVEVSDPRKILLFPDASSPAFSYNPNTGYGIEDTLVPGEGYWLKFPQNVYSGTFSGPDRTADTIDVTEGWNLIGTLSYPLDVNAIQSNPPGIIGSSFFRYNQGYIHADTLKPYLGYWIKVNANGQLFLDTNAMANLDKHIHTLEDREVTDSYNVITIQDAGGNSQRLYFSVSSTKDKSLLLSGELPPLPPSGIFDVRFASNRK